MIRIDSQTNSSHLKDEFQVFAVPTNSSCDNNFFASRYIYFKGKGFCIMFIAFGPLLLVHEINYPCLCALQSYFK